MPAEPAASPFHDWNARIAAECYRPNVQRGNVRRIGWDLGPTLARWMRHEQPDLHDAWVAQDDGHNGIAQGFHHSILPLASTRDRRTEIRWGLRDFELRFGRRATGVWLPETAADHLTLRICAEEGVRWTVLAPWQADAPVEVEHPRRIDLGDGHRMSVLFYDADLSARVSFDPGATSDADQFARHILRPRLDRSAAGSGPAKRQAALPAADPGVVLIATDGELYGHHMTFRDLFLERLLSLQDGFSTTTPGALMDGVDPAGLEPVPLRDGSSWSCHHGIARWSGECGCVPDGRWKRPLRAAFDRLAGGFDAAVEARLAGLGLDFWALRDRYVDVAAGFAEPAGWLDGVLAEREAGQLSRSGHPSLAGSDRDGVLTLMRATASRLQMYASDGWFWGDPRRVETAQVLRHAALAARLADATLGTALERRLVEDLAAVRAPDIADGALPELAELRTGDELYAAALRAVGQPPVAPVIQTA
ncbi:MAG: hypothetical protein QOH61_2284 [Chloroflexota bacterium]|nr:hypothetical protein [Chloroflexota bacterium]